MCSRDIFKIKNYIALFFIFTNAYSGDILSFFVNDFRFCENFLKFAK